MSRWTISGLEADLDRFHLGPLDFDLSPGRALAVLGASGAGKTTLLRTLAGFLRPSAGEIRCDGVDVSDWPPEARRLGYVPQGLGLFPHRTVAGNVRYPIELRTRDDPTPRVTELLERFRLAPLARRYPARLSGGELQRVALARALAADPELIVWDEPWQALDVLARYELGLVLHDLREIEQIPIIVVTHDPALAFSIADSFLVLRAGQVREQGDASVLLHAPSDPFVARFVGFENVYEREVLARGAPGSLRAWLLGHAGPEGVAVATPTLRPGAFALPVWEGQVRSARPGPDGVSVEVVADALLVSLRLPPPVTSPLPVLGARIPFAIDPATVRPLGAPSPPGAAR